MTRSAMAGSDRFVVVDVETTGVYNTDRVVEVAAVTVDPSGRIVDEWDTLVDPQRDVGPTHIHGVTASMVTCAPRFEDVAAALADRLYGAVVVAHNLPFDTRMLGNEYTRLGAKFVPGTGMCIMRLGGGKLVDVCATFHVELTHEHRALGDARATAQVLSHFLRRGAEPCSCAHVFDVTVPYSSRTLQREMSSADEIPMPYLARLASNVHHYGEQGAAFAYLDMLDWALADLVITAEERGELLGLAGDLGLTVEDVEAVHRRYMDELVAAALRDGVISDNERRLLQRAADALQVEADVLHETVDAWASDGGITLSPGMTVCFTGSATYADGSELPRTKLEHIAEGLGLAPTKAVTKSGCGLLVAADPESQSGKVGKARKFGVPVVAVSDFLAAHPGSRVPAAWDR